MSSAATYAASTRDEYVAPDFTTVIFDLDGTLVDSISDIHAALRVALQEVADGRHSQDADEEALRLGAHGLALDGFFRRVRPGAGEDGLRSFIAAYRQHYHSHLLDSTRPFPGVVEGLAQLRAGAPRLRLAVATTKLTATARRIVTELGLGEFFDWVQGSDGLRVKPDPQVLHVTLEALGRAAPGPSSAPASGARPATFDPRSCLMVGDTEFDILAGRAAGMRTCAVAWSEIPRARLLGAQPDHFADSFAHIVELVMAAHGA